MMEHNDWKEDNHVMIFFHSAYGSKSEHFAELKDEPLMVFMIDAVQMEVENVRFDLIG